MHVCFIEGNNNLARKISKTGRYEYVQAHSFKNIDTEDVDVKDHIITPEVENDVIPQNAKKSKIFGSM